MNLLLFAPDETMRPLSLDDVRARHVLQVLRRQVDDSFDVGLINGPRGKATILAIEEASMHLGFEWGEEPPPLAPVTLIVGLPRPQTARKVLEEGSALGVEAMHFVTSERGDPGYGQSRLWGSGEWRRHVIAGAEQAFSTRLPSVSWNRDLSQVLAELPHGATKLALDNYESPQALGTVDVVGPVAIAVGPERGWTDMERRLLREAGFCLVHLGVRVLRVETACVSAIALVLSRMGRM